MTTILEQQVTEFLTTALGRAPTSAELSNGLIAPFPLSQVHNSLSVPQSILTIEPTDNIQTALDKLNSNGGGILALDPIGTYTPTNSLNLYSNITLDLQGATIDFGMANYTLLANGTNGYTTGTVSITNNTNAVVGVGTTFTSAMVGQSILLQDFWYTISAVTDATDLTISENYVGGTLSGSNYAIATPISNVVIQNGTIQNGGGNLISGHYINQIRLTNITVTNATVGSSAGIVFNNSSGIVMNNVSSINCIYGFAFLNSAYSELSNIRTSFTQASGFYFSGCRNFEISTPSVESTTNNYGMDFIGCNLFDFSGIYITQTYGTGFRLENTLPYNSNFIINGGTIDTTVFSNQSGIALQGNASNIQIIGCNIQNCTNYGINNAAGTNTNVLVLGCVIKNNTTGAIGDTTDGILIRSNWGVADN